MLNLKNTSQAILALGLTLSMGACGGGNTAQQQGQPMGNMQQQQQGGNQLPHTMTNTQDGWTKVSIVGTTLTFEMPPPIDAQQLPTGELRYVSKQGKRSFTVAVASRNAQADKQQGITNEAALQTWADQCLQAQMMAFQQMKLQPNFKLTGSFSKNNAQGLRYAGTVGKANVLYLYLVTDVAFYNVEVITQTPQAPETKKFVDSIQP